jgi:hypothetical protein
VVGVMKMVEKIAAIEWRSAVRKKNKRKYELNLDFIAAYNGPHLAIFS